MVRTHLGKIIASLLALLTMLVCLGQDTPSKPPENDSPVSGVVSELTREKITVTRNILGKSETRSFIINSDTKVEGKLKQKSRVTIRFSKTDEGDVALAIIVRDGKAEKGEKKK